MNQILVPITLLVTFDINGCADETAPKQIPEPQGTSYTVYDSSGRLIGAYDGNQQLRYEVAYVDRLPVAVMALNHMYGIETDQNETPRALRDADDRVVWRWDGDAFGSAPADEDPDGDGYRVAFDMRFPGQVYDAESGLHYNYFRDYDPVTGRYLTVDPIGLDGTSHGNWSPYLYASNAATHYVDPLGLQVLSLVKSSEAKQSRIAMAALQSKNPTALIIQIGGDAKTGLAVDEDGRAVSPEKLAAIVTKQKLFNGQQIILVMCHAAQVYDAGRPSFAQQFANLLGAQNVLAANNAMRVTGGGAYQVGTFTQKGQFGPVNYTPCPGCGMVSVGADK
jgi:RHS repeat-associated protein